MLHDEISELTMKKEALHNTVSRLHTEIEAWEKISVGLSVEQLAMHTELHTLKNILLIWSLRL
jgi:hypothetical protein